MSRVVVVLVLCFLWLNIVPAIDSHRLHNLVIHDSRLLRNFADKSGSHAPNRDPYLSQADSAILAAKATRIRKLKPLIQQEMQRFLGSDVGDQRSQHTDAMSFRASLHGSTARNMRLARVVALDRSKQTTENEDLLSNSAKQSAYAYAKDTVPVMESNIDKLPPYQIAAVG